ncbi:MAG: vWA domain-containing protein [Planctomycetota bacterium]
MFRTMLLLTVGFALVHHHATAAEPDVGKSKLIVPKIEVCFVLDTTGSMAGLIQGAKDKIWSITNEMLEAKTAPDIKFGLIGYRDRGDTYVTQVHPMTSDVDEVHTKLMAFTAGGGGDTPESVNQALNEAVEKLNWSKDRSVLKLLFLVGDAPPHMDYDEIRYPEICKLAVEKDLVVNTIQCGRLQGTDVIWKEIATLTNGSYAAILQNGGTKPISTPYDQKIGKLNAALNKTVCAYGGDWCQEEAEQKIATQSAANDEAIADRAKYFMMNRKVASVRGGAGFGGGSANCVISGIDDLVTMLMDGKIKLDDSDEKKLPEDLKKMKPEQRRAEIKSRIDARRKTQAELDKIVKLRSDYIEAEKKKLASSQKPSGFDEQVKQMIRDQAARKGIEY